LKYTDGRLVLAGDVVRIDGQYWGTLVAAIDDASYLPGGEAWEYLGSGAMIEPTSADSCTTSRTTNS
jgi:hypothetical protein